MYTQTRWRKKMMELQRHLVEREEETHSSVGNDDTFAQASLWSRLTFQWLNPLFRQGRVRKLEFRHVPPVSRSESAENASSSLEESLSQQRFDDLALPFAIARTISHSLTLNAVFAVLNTVASYVGPLLITTFVNILHEKQTISSDGLVLAFVFFFAKTVESLCQRQWYFGAQKIGVRVKAALTVLIYKKSLSVKFVGSKNGKIVNLINVDVEKVGDFCLQIHELWLLPVQVVLALVILYKNLGFAPSFAALVSTVLVMMSNTPIANRQKSLHSKIMEAKDSRIKTTSEILKSMRILKLNSWEPKFLKKILHLRETERKWQKRYLYTSSAITFLFWASPTLVSVITFGVCFVYNTPLTSATVLSTLATFRILTEPIYNLPGLMSLVAQSKVSLERIEGFIREEDQMNIEYSPLDSSNAIDIKQTHLRSVMGSIHVIGNPRSEHKKKTHPF